MKQLFTFRKLLAIILLMASSSSLFAQKVEFETLEINYGDIAKGSNGVLIRNGSLVFTETTVLNIETIFKLKKDDDGYTAKITLKGKDHKGNSYQRAIDVAPLYKTESVKRSLKIDVEKGYDFIRISEVSLSVTDSKNNTTEASELIFNARPNTSFAILLNGIKPDDFCDNQKVKQVFMSEITSAENFAVVIGLNNTKKSSDIEKALLNGRGKVTGIYVWTNSNDQRTTRIVQPSVDADGNWTFKDMMPIKDVKNPPVLASFELNYVTACNDTFKYLSVFKQPLSDKKNWDYKVKMDGPVAIDNPIFQSGNGGMTNVLGLTAPSSSISVSNGNFVIRDKASFNMGISNTNVGNGGLDYKKINDVFVTIQFMEGDGRVFYHWGSVVSTSNPKIAVNPDSLKILNNTIKSMEIRMVNDKKDTIVYEGNGKYAFSLDGKEIILLLEKTEKVKFAPEKYAFGASSLIVNDIMPFKVLNFTFSLKKGSSIPAKMEAVVKVKSCDKGAEFITVKLKYDALKGIFTGSQAILQNQNCLIEIKDFSINIENECGDAYSAKNGFFDETNNKWVCQDECLKINTDTVCGETNHF